MATVLSLFAVIIAGVAVVGGAFALSSLQDTNTLTVGILFLSTFSSLVFAAILGALAAIVDRLQKIHILLARIYREEPKSSDDSPKEPHLGSFPGR